ncbi:ADP-ribosylglycohydrolase family protein [uncultured Cyclobacterium sp.]|uniref:ADP-ribosylglycohydrolase family protein n=1 Tax=uncultured Cyclobacterium sp. TaxID=453820 RepID=UPI0030EB96DA|tara:strand:- start:98162 stop:99439 length:1278 start_codon:yes stop_codon:yes gene_type:complete
MKKFSLWIGVLISCLVWSCKEEKKSSIEPKKTNLIIAELSKSELSDKIKGLLVGSAIGDAMGAPTEMWAREDIQKTYGWITGLDSMVREVSPEGIWKANLPAGGTTDDTRWKSLLVDYMVGENSLKLDAQSFSKHIIKDYEQYFDAIKPLKPEQTLALESVNLKVLWLQEWYKVSLSYQSNNLRDYHKALGKFYGGEMVCAGLLYSPAIGLMFPGQPEEAYKQAFELSIFDLGLAKDISSLSAAMTAAAMTASGDQNQVLNVLREVDPEGYFSSRLVGRSSYRVLELARSIVLEAKDSSTIANTTSDGSVIPEDSILRAYKLLDQKQQDMPFHAAEIHLQVLTAMLFSDFKFTETLVFLTNYGRDNDTTAAIAGAILGAFHGYENLPKDMREKVIAVNKTHLDIDLEKMSDKHFQNIQSLYIWPD